MGIQGQSLIVGSTHINKYIYIYIYYIYIYTYIYITWLSIGCCLPHPSLASIEIDTANLLAMVDKARRPSCAVLVAGMHTVQDKKVSKQTACKRNTHLWNLGIMVAKRLNMTIRYDSITISSICMVTDYIPLLLGNHDDQYSSPNT